MRSFGDVGSMSGFRESRHGWPILSIHARDSNARRGSKRHSRVGPEWAAAYPRLTPANSTWQKFLCRLDFLALDHRPEASVLRVSTVRLDGAWPLSLPRHYVQASTSLRL